MKVTTETVGTREVQLTIEPDEQTIQRAMRQAARDISRQRPIAGFRPGKAPYAMVERLYGRETILHEALHNVAPDIYEEAIREADIEPYEQTLMDLESEDPLVLKLNVPLMPKVELGDYSELSIEPEPEAVVSDEDIDEQIDMLRRQHAEIKPVTRPVQMGDQVAALLSRTVDGEVLERNQEVEIDLTDEVEPEGFAEALLGASPNEVREFKLSFPEDHADESLAGKTVEYRVAIGEVREVVLPEADDEFAKTVGDFETLDELRDALAEQIRSQRQQQAEMNERRRALEALVETAEIEYPEAALEHEIEHVLEQQSRRFAQMGFTMEGYLRMREMSEEDLREEVRADCVRNLRQRLVLIDYMRNEGISLSEEDATEAFSRYTNSMLSAYGEDAAQQIREAVQGGALDAVYHDALLNKASRHLTDRLTGRLEETEAEELPEAAGEETPAAGSEAETQDTASDETETAEETSTEETSAE